MHKVKFCNPMIPLRFQREDRRDFGPQARGTEAVFAE